MMKLVDRLILLAIVLQLLIGVLWVFDADHLYLNIAIFLSLLTMAAVRNIKLQWRLKFVDFFSFRGNSDVYKDEWKVMIWFIPTFCALVFLLNNPQTANGEGYGLVNFNFLVLVVISIREFFLRVKF